MLRLDRLHAADRLLALNTLEEAMKNFRNRRW